MPWWIALFEFTYREGVIKIGWGFFLMAFLAILGLARIVGDLCGH